MDIDEPFEDLFDEENLLQDSSQESLINAAANISFEDHNKQEEESPSTLATSIYSLGFINHGDASSDAPLKDAPHDDLVPSGASNLVDQIEDVFESISKALLDERRQLRIRLKVRPRSSASQPDTRLLAPSKYRDICFPGKTAAEAWRFSVTIRILELIHEALHNNVILSKRDIYYRDPALFGNQGVVDRYVDDIASTFNTRRSQLNVTAAAKGLVAGAFRLCRRDGSLVDASGDRDGMLITPAREILSIDMTAIRWILVIEKEATFRSIAASSFWETIRTCGVIITGKGYPDIATRALLHFMSTSSPQNGFASPPVFGLADCDPDGLAILSIYQRGSSALSHENEELRVPQLQWLGLRIDHMMDYVFERHNQGLLSLTARDRRKAVKMLGRSVPSEDDAELYKREALQTMLMLNTKAELQLLDAVPNGMTNLLGSNLGHL